MAVKTPTPEPSGEARRNHARSRRIAATEIANNRHHAPAVAGSARTKTNGEEDDYRDSYATNFTKGLQHDAFGVLLQPEDYELFVDGINQESDTLGVPEGRSWFEENVPKADPTLFTTTINGAQPDWRGWESPRSGHAYDLEGPDAESLCMAPAPKLSSPELHVEVAEVFTLALLRDVPFTKIVEGSGEVNGNTVNQIVGEIADMDWFNGTHPPQNELENRRCLARGNPPKAHTLFRGSAPGVNDGPYISQFLLSGTNGHGDAAPDTGIPGTDAAFSMSDGYIQYGTQVIDQRVAVHQPGVDYMTQWHAWLDVQNGAKTGGTDLFLKRRRFITTPRDLATYVHFDQLYQAYFNAALMLNAVGATFSLGFPSGERQSYSKDKNSPNEGTIKRDSFATFGGPHLLALLTEVSTRALRAVRRQKFNYHRRCRPEAMGWLATLASSTNANKLGLAEGDAVAMKNALPDMIKDAIVVHNQIQNSTAKKDMRKVKCDDDEPDWITDNLLLPMAFPEGSPMHPSYGAGHATVAGACVTILKAFHQLRDNSGDRLPYKGDTFVPVTADNTNNEDDWGATLQQLSPTDIKDENDVVVELTIEGELNKLAANIAIGRNMAGVHFYTDYYDSLRLGERIAVGILQEQMTNYPDAVTITFWDFDDNKVQIHSSADVNVMVSVGDSGAPATDAWWNCSPAVSPQPAALVFAENEQTSSPATYRGKSNEPAKA